MKVLVDSPVWSFALRRRPNPKDTVISSELAILVQDGRAAMIGAVRQEILSGIKQRAQFDKLREHLRAFPDIEITTNDYEQAASFFNRCREKGIQGSNTDFLICAVAARHGFSIFTTDRDFVNFAKVLPITHHQTGA
jgi:predicted nucleic acid-binding protein